MILGEITLGHYLALSGLLFWSAWRACSSAGVC